ncbi:hypothetical protein POM88_023020 [Heracleum sosnowskyi]|uniref:Rhamnogalacturonan lyase domain-containing protein n=1 Tax=Heracleum sosnowskyi TaxID=360622 RepID=A0AAD8IJW1_9APIA|nr:hypothetical protein POM88_023020 [Heracleum sosnowskyi]
MTSSTLASLSKGFAELSTDGQFMQLRSKQVRDYNLYAWVPGFIGDFRWEKLITVTPGGSTDAGTLTYKPPRDGPTLWEIGTPNRSAASFFVPEPDPNYIKKLYVNHPDK